MIQSFEQESHGFHAFRLAPAALKGVMDPFLSISVVELKTPTMPRPQAGYTTFLFVFPSSGNA